MDAVVRAPARRRAVAGALATLCLLSSSAAPQVLAAGPQRGDAAALMDDLMADRRPIGGPFALTDQRGRRVGTKQWQGRVVLLYFGYLACPDICPNDLAAIGSAIGMLGSLGEQVQPVFVTLDPARDTPERIGPYAEHFHPRFLALRGTEHETRAIAKSYKVYFAKEPRADGQGYAIDHSSFTYVLDDQGRYAGFFPPGTTGTRIAERLRDMVKAP